MNLIPTKYSIILNGYRTKWWLLCFMLLFICIVLIYITSQQLTTTFNPSKTIKYSPPISPTVNAIPRVIHFTYIHSDEPITMITETYRSYIQSCIQNNPNMKFVLWTKENMNKFLDKYATNEMRQFIRKDRRLPIARSDVFRYIIIYYFGGIYMDLDTFCQRPIYDYIKYDSCVIAREPSIQSKITVGMDLLLANYFLACEPRHPFMRQLLENLNKNPSTDDSVLKTTGPVYLTEQYQLFSQNHEEYKVGVLTSTLFYPRVNLVHLRANCNNSQGKISCDELENYIKWVEEVAMKYVVLAHDFLHLGWSKNSGPSFDAFKVFPNLQKWP